MKAGVDHIGVGCGAFIVNDNNELLLLKRTENCRNEAGKWMIPGGRVEFNERVEDALIREVKEEINVDIEIEEEMFFLNHLVPDENQHWVSLILRSRIVGGELKNLEPHKCSELRWWPLDKLPHDELSISAKIIMEKLK